MVPEAREVRLRRGDRKELEVRCRSPRTLQSDLKRARIVLLAANGMSTAGDCQGSWRSTADCQPLAASLRRPRARRAARTSRVPAKSRSTRRRRTSGYWNCWTSRRRRDLGAGPDLCWPRRWAMSTSNMSGAACGTTRSIWRPANPGARSNDPDFAAKAADVVGLYVNPPGKAIVLCVDEKPSIQALERAQGYLKLPNGRALTGQSHDYKRHGTTTLFAALQVATGKVIAAHSKRRRRVEFLGFMDSVVAAFPTANCTSSSTTSTPTKRTSAGSRSTQECTSTSPRRGHRGSIRSRLGSPSCRASR